MIRDERFQLFLNVVYGAIFSLYTCINITIMMSQLYTQSSTALELYRILQVPIIVGLLVIGVLRGYKPKSLCLILLCLLFSFYGYYVNQEKRVLMLFLFAFAARSVHPRKILKVDFVVRIFSFLMVLVLSLEGVLANTVLYRADGTARYTLGFGHPNYGGIALLTIFLEWIALKKGKLTSIEGIIIILVSYIFNTFFNARTDYGITILMVITIIVVQSLNSEKVNRFIKEKIAKNMVWILAMVSWMVLLLVKQGTHLYSVLDGALSSRLSIFNFYYKNFGVHFLPQKITEFFQDSTFFGMDNAYIFLGVYLGIILFIMVCMLEQVIAKKLVLENMNVVFVYIFTLLIGLTESTMLYPFIGFVVVYFGQTSLKDVEGE